MEIIPCKDCILLAICKTQMAPYMERNDRVNIALGFFQKIAPKCVLASDYIENRHLNKSMLSSIHDLCNEAFK